MNNDILLKLKLFFVFSLIIIISIILLRSATDLPDKKTTAYQQLISKSELVVVGNVSDITLKREVLGMSGDRPYYATFQYITLNIEKTIKGNPRSNPIVIQALKGFMDEPVFYPRGKCSFDPQMV